mmetsp:Transcript_8359/g.20348  ORF Transcript_8359/g.20348 Transcript_8359/m.20348 type:complete len:238 (+) Transcript_8359:697-1410(+)
MSTSLLPPSHSIFAFQRSRTCVSATAAFLSRGRMLPPLYPPPHMSVRAMSFPVPRGSTAIATSPSRSPSLRTFSRSCSAHPTVPSPPHTMKRVFGPSAACALKAAWGPPLTISRTFASPTCFLIFLISSSPCFPPDLPLTRATRLMRFVSFGPPLPPAREVVATRRSPSIAPCHCWRSSPLVTAKVYRLSVGSFGVSSEKEVCIAVWIPGIHVASVRSTRRLGTAASLLSKRRSSAP